MAQAEVQAADGVERWIKEQDKPNQEKSFWKEGIITRADASAWLRKMRTEKWQMGLSTEVLVTLPEQRQLSESLGIGVVCIRPRGKFNDQ